MRTYGDLSAAASDVTGRCGLRAGTIGKIWVQTTPPPQDICECPTTLAMVGQDPQRSPWAFTYAHVVGIQIVLYVRAPMNVFAKVCLTSPEIHTTVPITAFSPERCSI